MWHCGRLQLVLQMRMKRIVVKGMLADWSITVRQTLVASVLGNEDFENSSLEKRYTKASVARPTQGLSKRLEAVWQPVGSPRRPGQVRWAVGPTPDV